MRFAFSFGSSWRTFYGYHRKSSVLLVHPIKITLHTPKITVRLPRSYSMSNPHKYENRPPIGTATIGEIIMDQDRGQQQQAQQPAVESRAEAQASTFVLDERNHLISPTTSHVEHSSIGNCADLGSINTSVHTKYAAKALAQFKQQTEQVPLPHPSPSVIATSDWLKIAAARGYNLQEKSMHSGDTHENLSSQSTRTLDSAPTNQPVAAQSTTASPPSVLYSTLPFPSMVTSQQPTNQHFLTSQLNAAAALTSDARTNQQPLSVTMAPSPFDGYRAIQDSPIMVTTPQYLTQHGGIAVQSPRYSYHHHDTTIPPTMVLQALNPPASSVQARLAQMRYSEGMHISTNKAYSSLGTPHTPIDHSAPVLDAARADRIARLSDLLAGGQSVHSFAPPPPAPIPAYYSHYTNNHSNTLKPPNSSSSSNFNNWNVASVVTPTNTTAENDSTQRYESSSQLPQKHSISVARDWDKNPAFPKTAAFEQRHHIFPVILHRALTELERVPQGSDIAAFSPDGKSFQIRSQYLFEQQVLPIFFPKMRIFGSFQRQLNLYNFQRSNRDAGKDRGSYRHELFERDCPAKVHGMKRTKLKGGPPRRGPRVVQSPQLSSEAPSVGAKNTAP